MQIEETIKERLTAAFQPVLLEVVNDSHRHAGHASSPGTGESHFSVRLVASAFSGKSRIERHRMVNEALADPTIADAICDRLVHNAHVLKLGGPSIRKKKALQTEPQTAS